MKTWKTRTIKEQKNIFVSSDRPEERWFIAGTLSVDFPNQMGTIDYATVLLKQEDVMSISKCLILLDVGSE